MIWNLFFALMRLVRPLFAKSLGKLSDMGPKFAQFPFPETVIAALWWILWLASAAGISSTPEATAATKGRSGGVHLGYLQALMAFLWLSWFTWTGILALSALQHRQNIMKAAGSADSNSSVKAADVEGGLSHVSHKADAAGKVHDTQKKGHVVDGSAAAPPAVSVMT